MASRHRVRPQHYEDGTFPTKQAILVLPSDYRNYVDAIRLEVDDDDDTYGRSYEDEPASSPSNC